jgi:membrane-associated phospholipid phosphatase
MGQESEPFLPVTSQSPSRRLGLLVTSALFAGLVLLIGLLTVRPRAWWRPNQEESHDLFDAAHGHDTLTTTADWVGHLTIPTVLRVITVIGAVVLWRRGLRTTALWWAVTVIVSGAIAIVVREIVARPRPHWPGSGPVVDGYTYPSGHATSAAVFAGCVVVVLWPHVGRAGRAIAVGVALLFFVAVGVSRLILGVHSIADVLAAWALAACLLSAMIVLGAEPAVRRRIPSGSARNRRSDSRPSSKPSRAG